MTDEPETGDPSTLSLWMLPVIYKRKTEPLPRHVVRVGDVLKEENHVEPV